MTRNHKIFGSTLVTALMLCAFMGSTAFAQQGKITVGETLIGQEAEGTVNSLTAFANEVKCPESIYTGHKYDATPHQLIPSEATTVI